MRWKKKNTNWPYQLKFITNGITTKTTYNSQSHKGTQTMLLFFPGCRHTSGTLRKHLPMLEKCAWLRESQKMKVKCRTNENFKTFLLYICNSGRTSIFFNFLYICNSGYAELETKVANEHNYTIKTDRPCRFVYGPWAATCGNEARSTSIPAAQRITLREWFNLQTVRK